MKKLVKSKEGTIGISEITSDEYFGIIAPNGERYFLMMIEREAYLINPSYSSFIPDADSIEEALQQLLKKGVEDISGYYKSVEIYVFESEFDILNWLNNMEELL